MKVLIYGAGVLGRLYAYLFSQNGIDVTLLARGDTLSALQADGIKLHFVIQDEWVECHVPLIESVLPGADFDLILVVMQKNQALTILPSLAAIQSRPDIIFLGNNGTGIEEYCPPLDPRQVILGFPNAGGMRAEGHLEIAFSPDTPIWMGEIDGKTSPRLVAYQKLFAQAGLRVNISSDIDAYLKYHIALVSPLANALIAVGCDNVLLTDNYSLMRAALKAIREGFRVLQALGYPMQPKSLRVFKLPAWLIIILWKKRLQSREARIAMAGHADFARGEMRRIADEFQALVEESGQKAPWIANLRQNLASNPTGS